MQKIYIQYENLNEKYPIAAFGDDGEIKARFANETSAERWATRNWYIVGMPRQNKRFPNGNKTFSRNLRKNRGGPFG